MIDHVFYAGELQNYPIFCKIRSLTVKQFGTVFPVHTTRTPENCTPELGHSRDPIVTIPLWKGRDWEEGNVFLSLGSTVVSNPAPA